MELVSKDQSYQVDNGISVYIHQLGAQEMPKSMG